MDAKAQRHMNAMSRSEQMARIKSRDTEPELIVRKMVFAAGYRYRLHREDLAGTPDLVFPRLRKIVFVHGCFWHQHNCPAGRIPKTNLDYWVPKLERNTLRDQENLRALKANGWRCLVVWECQLRRPSQVRRRLVQFLES